MSPDGGGSVVNFTLGRDPRYPSPVCTRSPRG